MVTVSMQLSVFVIVTVTLKLSPRYVHCQTAVFSALNSQ